MTLDDSKQAMRRQARVRRGAAHRASAAIGKLLARNFLAWSRAALEPGTVIAGYHPIGDEADSLPLLADLAAMGHPICLPITSGRAQPLRFRAWVPGAPLVAGAFGVSEPAADAGLRQPQLLLVPLLAFDRAGGRLGYGAGHYDRTFGAWNGAPPLKVGVAYAAQCVECVPMGETDHALDAVLTEEGLLWRAPSAGRGVA